jgi:hypothetical protein
VPMFLSFPINKQDQNTMVLYILYDVKGDTGADY